LRKRRISKWPPELNRYFAGRIACINPDADEPGRRFAQEIARNLHGVAKEVRIVEIPGLKDGEDVKEFFERGGTPDELRRLGDDAPLWVPGEKSQSSGLESAAASTYVMRGMTIPKARSFLVSSRLAPISWPFPHLPLGDEIRPLLAVMSALGPQRR
jgi:hypothetical protein